MGQFFQIHAETPQARLVRQAVDVVRNRQLVASDVGEGELVGLLDGSKAKIIVTVIGGQGYIFGRGNQQIGARVIDRVGLGNILVVATLEKIASLRENTLHVDTGDPVLDQALVGWRRVVTGYGNETVCKVGT